ncbi:MAG TPA: hypothetical protein VHU23_09085 [Rhizomicrobium sp.]|jgi:hypothetical protein|nr:hypothetical protein [Rhizomicrobium sp.]
MGAARLLAKGWIFFCMYVGGLALGRTVMGGIPLEPAAGPIFVCVLLFGAMGVLFIAGYGLSAGHVRPLLPERLSPSMLIPGFNELVFIAFTLIVFAVQVFYAPVARGGGPTDAIEGAIRFGVVGETTLETSLVQCNLDGGRLLVSALSWLLALIYLGSALSRIRLAAGIIRLERKQRPEALGAQPLALVLGLAAVIGFQLLYMGTGYGLLSCEPLRGLWGDAVIGFGPLALSYLIVAALANLLALGPSA